jgi:hypothetical protein
MDAASAAGIRFGLGKRRSQRKRDDHPNKDHDKTRACGKHNQNAPLFTDEVLLILSELIVIRHKKTGERQAFSRKIAQSAS